MHTYLRARGEILQAGGVLVKLAQNFRSTTAVVDGYNAVFDLATGFFRAGAGIDYDQPVTCGDLDRRLCGTGGESEPGVVVLDVQSAGDTTRVADSKRALRRQMVEEIRGLLSEDGRLFVEDGKQRRPIEARNIFVLAFTHSECDEIGEALRAAGIHFAFYKEGELFRTTQAKDVLDLLRAIAEPQDHTLRARALLTAFFAFDLTDLAGRDRPEAEESPAAPAFPVARPGPQWGLRRPLSTILGQSGMVCREVCLSPSERALTNTLHIFEILQEEAARTHATLRELVETLGAYVNGTRLPAGDQRDVQRLESDAQAVQVMTVHAAKGLEADVVFLYGGLGRKTGGSLSVFHDHAGQRVVHVGSLTAEEREMCSNEAADEDRRLLYVALTRARARLIIPRCPPGPRDFTGCYRLLGPILDKLLEDGETSKLFHRVPVDCPGEPPLVLPAPAPAALSSWQPPELPAGVPSTEFHRIARTRAGFVITSYTGVKRRHGGFVVPEEPADLSTANEPVESADAAPDDPGELARGRLSGIFLHAILEEVPLDGLPNSGSTASGQRGRRSRSYSLGLPAVTNAIRGRLHTPRNWYTRRW